MYVYDKNFNVPIVLIINSSYLERLKIKKDFDFF